jgi:hypothetical protein
MAITRLNPEGPGPLWGERVNTLAPHGTGLPPRESALRRAG